MTDFQQLQVWWYECFRNFIKTGKGAISVESRDLMISDNDQHLSLKDMNS